MKKAIIGKKLGMTQIFDENGSVIPVTLIEAGPCVVVQVKTVEKDGYDAVQLGFIDEKAKHLTKAEMGHFAKANVPYKKHLKEFRLDQASEKADVTGITKGRGYTGSIKRWNHHILKMTHGTGPVHREVGSMGANSSPSRVFKNKKMAGQYGNEQVTVLNLEIVRVDAEKNLIAVKGAVPGAKEGIVFLRNSCKA